MSWPFLKNRKPNLSDDNAAITINEQSCILNNDIHDISIFGGMGEEVAVKWLTNSFAKMFPVFFGMDEQTGSELVGDSGTWSAFRRCEVQVPASLGTPADWVMGWAKWLSLVCTFNSCQRPILDKPWVFFSHEFLMRAVMGSGRGAAATQFLF